MIRLKQLKEINEQGASKDSSSVYQGIGSSNIKEREGQEGLDGNPQTKQK